MPLNLPFEKFRATGPVALAPDWHFQSTQESRLALPRNALLMDIAVHCVGPHGRGQAFRERGLNRAGDLR